MWYKFFGIWIIFGYRTFIGKYKQSGLSKQKLSSPVIFIANHQNAFIDPLSVMVDVYRHYEVGFMVRQDVFNNKIAAAFLRSIKLFPAYRIRDGFKNLNRNQKSFDYAHKRFLKGNGVIIFAEGSHAAEKKLRPLKKGPVRMAFDSLKRDYDDLDLKIIPVGINYSDATKFGSEVYVNFGDAIDPKDYFKTDPKEETQAINALNSVLQDELAKLMIDIKNLEDYDEIHYLKDLYLSENRMLHSDLREKFLAEQEAVKIATDYSNSTSWKDTKKDVKEIMTWLDQHQLRDYLLSLENKKLRGGFLNWISLILLFPFALVGTIINYWPAALSKHIASTKVKDPGFVSSFYFGLALILFSLWYFISTIVLCLTLPVWWYGLFTIPVFYGLGKVAVYWLRKRKSLAKKLKLAGLLKTSQTNLIIEKRKHVFGAVFKSS